MFVNSASEFVYHLVKIIHDFVFPNFLNMTSFKQIYDLNYLYFNQKSI